jgi:hypothetical protein
MPSLPLDARVCFLGGGAKLWVKMALETSCCMLRGGGLCGWTGGRTAWDPSIEGTGETGALGGSAGLVSKC